MNRKEGRKALIFAVSINAIVVLAFIGPLLLFPGKIIDQVRNIAKKMDSREVVYGVYGIMGLTLWLAYWIFVVVVSYRGKPAKDDQEPLGADRP